MQKKRKTIEYMCRYCGARISKKEDQGRPMPGTCRRRGPNQPHSWVKNREW